MNKVRFRLNQHTADLLTALRILCGLLILCLPAFSGWFYTFYLLGGFTDAIDGTVARKLGQASDFGAKLDTVADFVFFAAVIVRLIGTVQIPSWLLMWAGMILMIKIVNAAIGIFRCRRFVAVHSTLNRICGILLFVTPLFMGMECMRRACTAEMILICVVATIAAIHEGYIIYHSEKE